MFSVFLSHSVGESEEKVIESLASQLTGQGTSIYVAERDTTPGRSLSQKIQNAIMRSDVVLVLVTEKGSRSAWVNQEIGYAVAKGKTVIPILERGVEAKGMLVGIEHIRLDPEAVEKTVRQATVYLAQLKLSKEEKIIIGIVIGLIGVLILLLVLSR